jgi:DNA-binding NarL/FixJ family response regulator
MTDKKNIKVLFIEDEDLLRSLFGEVFLLDEAFTYDVISAMDLKSGLEQAKSKNPDVIILDLILPYDKTTSANEEDLSEKMGLAFLKEMKNNENFKHVPVVVFSNMTDLEIRKQVMDAGAHDFLIKSETTPDKFLNTIKSVTGNM